MKINSNIKVSVIIPVYNVFQYLDRCIESIISQTIKEIEIILIDDGSSDGSSDICNKWALIDSRIQVIHKANEGQSKARNMGMNLACGEYIAFVDSDDFISPETYETLYNECSNKKLDIAYFCFDRFDSDGNIWINSYLKKTEFYSGHEQIMRYFLNVVGRVPSEYNQFHYTSSASMALYKHSIIQEHHILFKDVREISSEDLIFNLELIPHTQNIGVFPLYLYHYYVNNHSTTTTYSEAKYKRLIRCLYCVEDICKKYFSYEEYSQHFCSRLLEIYKVILRYESKSNMSISSRCARMKEICRNPLLTKMYLNPLIREFSVGNRFFIWCMKHSFVYTFIIIYAIKKNS